MVKLCLQPQLPVSHYELTHLPSIEKGYKKGQDWRFGYEHISIGTGENHISVGTLTQLSV